MIDLDITVVTPTIPPRGEMLLRALRSVTEQTLPARALSVAVDTQHAGAASTRQRALEAVQTGWTAFLDDDDWFYPQHLETLARLIITHDADYAYSWFDGNNPFPQHRGKQMNPVDPHHTTTTVLVRTSLAREARIAPHADANEVWPGEDWRFTQRCVDLGARFIGTADVTWFYHVHSGNTSGLGTGW